MKGSKQCNGKIKPHLMKDWRTEQSFVKMLTHKLTGRWGCAELSICQGQDSPRLQLFHFDTYVSIKRVGIQNIILYLCAHFRIWEEKGLTCLCQWQMSTQRHRWSSSHPFHSPSFDKTMKWHLIIMSYKIKCCSTDGCTLTPERSK